MTYITILRLNFLSNIVTAIAFYTLTGQLLYVVSRANFVKSLHLVKENGDGDISNKDKLSVVVNSIQILFALFIFLCGVTHTFNALECYYNNEEYSIIFDYWRSISLLIACVVAVLTALVGFKLFPYIVNVIKKMEETQTEKLQLVEVVETCLDSIAVVSSNLILIQGNNATYSFFGENFKNHSVMEFIYNHDDIINFQKCVESLVLKDYKETTIQYRCYSNCGGEDPIWFESVIRKRKRVKYVKFGSDYEFMMITRNIDEKKRAEDFESAKESRKELDRINEAKLMYITCVAHELRTPLQSFCSSLGLLINSTQLQPEQVELIDQALISSEMMRLTIAQAMHIGKSLSGAKLTPSKNSLSLRGLIDKVKTAIVNYSKRLPITYDVSSDIHDSIVTDQEWLLMILLNLLTNACKYTEIGKIQLSVFLKPDEKDMLVFEVRDTGSGIPEDKIANIFVPFSLATEGKSEGTGLGLYSVNCSAVGLGGSCGVRNNFPGRGSTFWVNIPYVKDESSSLSLSLKLSDINSRLSPPIKSIVSTDFTQIPSAVKQAMSPFVKKLQESIFGKGLKAIVVDDVLTIRKLLSKTLQTFGFESVDCYEDGLQGLNALMTQEVDIVLSDVQMPIMSGPEMVEKFRKFEISTGRKKRQVIIAITANRSEEMNSQGNNSLFDKIVSKPLETGEMAKIILEHLFSR